MQKSVCSLNMRRDRSKLFLFSQYVKKKIISEPQENSLNMQ